MHSAPVHIVYTRFRPRARLSRRLNSLEPPPPSSPPPNIYTGLLAAVNNDISRSGQTPLFQPVSRNRYNECNESFLKNEFFPEFPLLSRILPSICGIVHLDERTGPVPRIFLPSTPALIFLTTEIWNWSLIEREREREDSLELRFLRNGDFVGGK